MGTEKLTLSLLRHVETVFSSVDYPDISRHGSRCANAYRLARKEMQQLRKRLNDKS